MIESNVLDLSSTLGLIATAVLSFNFLLGILLSTAYRRSPLWKRMPAWVRRVSLDDLHNWTAYVALALAFAHPVVLLADKALKYRVADIVLPVSAPHQPVWTVLGSLALYALIVVIVTTQKAVKRRLGFRTWKNIHLVSYGTALLFVIHGLVMDPELKDRPIDWLDGEKLLSEICGLLLIAAAFIRWRHYRRATSQKSAVGKVLMVLLAATVLSGSLHAQNAVTGRITDALSGSPLSGVSVYIPDLKSGAVSGQDGSYRIRDLPSGVYVISITMIGFDRLVDEIAVKGTIHKDYRLRPATIPLRDVVVTGVPVATDKQNSPYIITTVDYSRLLEASSTNVIDAISKEPGVSAMTDGQSISKPVIRGLGYNRVLTINDGVEQVDQTWFDEFGIEADPDAVHHYEILKGPASLAYGSDAIAGVVNLIPADPLPEGQTKGDILVNYQTNNGLINAMGHVAGTRNGISWSARIDNIMAHSYRDPYDGYVLNSQFSDFNTDATISLHRGWGYMQLHASYFDMATGIVDGTRDSATGIMEREVAYPGLNGGEPTYVIPTHQEQTSYTPFVINQRIRHSKLVWDNHFALGTGYISAIFSGQKNQRQETNDPALPDSPDIYYYSTGGTYDVRYVSPQFAG
ncbi:MAG TPA: TonB-dependent receptor plug domain-containing protein, partial [Puia sp.]|nr:TonB-dependent receptor plug domain-containing protein [Puia sp.]